MGDFLNSIYTLWNQLIFAVSNISVFDIIDIAIISFILYKAFKFLRESRAGQLFKGLIILVVVYGAAKIFHLNGIDWILSKFFEWAILAVAIVFQPELRRMLERLGRSKFGKIVRFTDTVADAETIKRSIDSICVATKTMKENKIGALIVFEKSTQLGEIINTGTIINADTSSQMVGNIFFPKSPLHDGALIVRGGKLCAAGCILPLTSNPNLSSQLGTRHRAAIGMSEVSDAVILIVSEETGMISLAQNGNIKRGYDLIQLRERLYELLVSDLEDDNDISFFGKLKASGDSFFKKLKKNNSEGKKNEN